MTATPKEIVMREPCCTVFYSGSDHVPHGPTWYLKWLPKGYGPTREDRLICAFPEPPDGSWSEFGLSRGKRPPLIEAVAKAVEDHYKAASGKVDTTATKARNAE